MGGVVVECANDDAARPGSYASEGYAFQFSGAVTRLHVAHLAVMFGRNPCGERFDFAELPDGSDPAQVESSLAGELFDTGWKVRRHGDGVRASFRSNRMVRRRPVNLESNVIRVLRGRTSQASVRL